MGKLTLSVDEEVVSQAKEFAKSHGTSVSEMVETYLASITIVYKGKAASPETPILNSLRGVLKNTDIKDYRQHLEKKYL